MKSLLSYLGIALCATTYVGVYGDESASFRGLKVNPSLAPSDTPSVSLVPSMEPSWFDCIEYIQECVPWSELFNETTVFDHLVIIPCEV